MEAIQKKTYVEYLLDLFLYESEEEQRAWVAEHTAEITHLERRLKIMAENKPTNRERLREITDGIEQGDVYKRQCPDGSRRGGSIMAQYKLVIAEKPSVAQSLAAVIGATARKDGYLEGNGWRVSWCVGHLAGLADADSYDPKYAKWRYDDLPILPEHWQMVVGKDKKKQFDILKKLMNAPDVTEVVNACDAGREGELIFRSVYELADCQKPMKRLWISSMEDSAILTFKLHIR